MIIVDIESKSAADFMHILTNGSQFTTELMNGIL
jgi:hypothetical protein